MPEKDGSDDKKSTKSVVSKKQKQFMNKEQLDLTSVAEYFGGKIVGEPVLVEFKQSPPPDSANQIKKFNRTKIKTNKYLDFLKKGLKVKSLLGLFKKHPKVAVATTLLTPTPLGDGTLDGNKEIIAKLKKQNLLKTPDQKEIDKISPLKKKPDETTPETTPEKKDDTDTKVDLNKLKNIDNKNKKIVTTNKNDLDNKKDNKTNLAITPLVRNQKVNTKKKTKIGTGKAGIPKLPKLSGTVHNVGRRVNPQ
jgi:DNA repair exonuclease SbcCD nuclease subunit